MHTSRFTNGSFVVHGITGQFKGKVSAWFRKDGKLLDAEQIIDGSTRQVKRDGPTWKYCQQIGERVCTTH